jgi:ATP-dependent Lhr-like helicase
MVAARSSAVNMLHPKVVELIEKRGWQSLTEIQEKAMLPILRGDNVVIVAPTGYGKTEAALLPILSKMVEEKPEPVSVLYITPLRALINDLYERISWWANQLGFVVARKHGDVSHSERARRLRKIPHILITTPESLEIDLDWASRFRVHYKNLKWVIVDEVHEIVSSKRGVQLAVLLERFRKLAGDFQLVLISATIGKPEIIAETFKGSSKRPVSIISVDKRKEIEILVDYVDAPSTEFWKHAAEKLLMHMEPLTLVFVNSKHVAEKLHEEIEKKGISDVVIHHASIYGEERQKIERLAKEGKVKMIIATKTLELGIDIGSVKKVILFRPAGSVASLIQRLGRSGHEVDGIIRGVIIATDKVELLEALAEARLAVRGEVEPPRILSKPLDMVARAIIGMALSGMYNVDEAYEIIKNVKYFEGLSRDEFDVLVRYLIENKMIKLNGDNKLSPGSQFYRIWRFDAGELSKYSWWVHNFSEFFTTIGEKKAYMVKTIDGKTVGELDAEYVMRLLRVGQVLRLGGKNWQVVDIDEHNNKVTITEAPTLTATVPFWRGQGPMVSSLVVKELEKVLEELHSGGLKLPEKIKLTDAAKKALKELEGEVKKYRYPHPSSDTIIIEQMSDEIAYMILAQENVVRTLAYLVMLEMYRDNSEAYTKITHYGFSIPSRILSFDPLKFLASLEKQEFFERVREAAERSHFFIETVHSIQLVFGITRKLTPNDLVVYKEAIRQTIDNYFAPEDAWNIIEKLKQGKIKVKMNVSRASIYARTLAKEAPEKPWIGNVEDLVAEILRGMAFTVDEISEALGLPENVVESALRSMKAPNAKHRVFSFIDVDTSEERWALVEDAEKIAKSEEFSSSFNPPNKDALYLMLVKNESGSLVHIVANVRDVMERPNTITQRIPFDEIYEMKVTPLASYYEGKPIKYQFIPKRIAPLLLLNAAAITQKIEATNLLV